jgi:hypothetical protein
VHRSFISDKWSPSPTTRIYKLFFSNFLHTYMEKLWADLKNAIWFGRENVRIHTYNKDVFNSLNSQQFTRRYEILLLLCPLRHKGILHSGKIIIFYTHTDLFVEYLLSQKGMYCISRSEPWTLTGNGLKKVLN